MIDALKEAVALVEKLPHMALWILAGLLLYKIIVIGSWFGIARLLIERAHSFLMRPPPPQQIAIGRLLLGVDEGDIERLLKLVTNRPNSGFGSTHFHTSDLRWVQAAITEKIKRDEVPK